MRTAREKVPGGDSYYHVMNRYGGKINEHPFTDEVKEYGMHLVMKYSYYYLVEPISMCWMGNHYHIALYVPGDDELPSLKEIVQRHNEFYKDNPGKQLRLEDKVACEKVRKNMADISQFMKAFQQKFTFYINRLQKRRGKFWADRFKSTIIEGSEALWNVVEYIELNPVRAGIVKNPDDYRFCSWGKYKGSGKHIFYYNFIKHMKKALGDFATDWSNEQLLSEFAGELTRVMESERGLRGEKLDESVKLAKKGESMPIQFLNITRHWTDGGIIGSEEFVQETAFNFKDKEKVLKKQFSHGITPKNKDLYCYKMLRKGVKPS